MCIAIGIIACESKEGAYSSGDDAEIQNEADTTTIDGELNSRGAPREGLPHEGAGDTIGLDRILQENNVPAAVIEKINSDASLSSREITSVREFDRGDTTFYELTYDGEESNKVVLDQFGGKGDTEDVN